jgi:type IV pilus assembly protein PilM
MNKLMQKLVPRKNHFVGVDIGAYSIKIVETRILDNEVEIVSQHCYPSIPGVWTDNFDEEALVVALNQGAIPLNEVISCIGGEKVITRSSRFPVMSDKELAGVVQIEISKFLPVSKEQMEIRHVRLDQGPGIQASKKAAMDFTEGAGQRVLLLAVPSATVYQYHSIFLRAGMTVTAFDLQAFALWRVFGGDLAGTVAIIDIGERTSHLVVVKNGSIQFIRLMPVGGETLTKAVADTFSVDIAQARELKEESSVARDSEIYLQSGVPQRIGNALREGLTELIKEVRRSLNFCSTQERLNVERIILSGGTSKLNGITDYCQEMLGLKTEIGIPQAGLPGQNASLRLNSKGKIFDIQAEMPEQGYDPVYAVALGLAMRGMEP